MTDTCFLAYMSKIDVSHVGTFNSLHCRYTLSTIVSDDPCQFLIFTARFDLMGQYCVVHDEHQCNNHSLWVKVESSSSFQTFLTWKIADFLLDYLCEEGGKCHLIISVTLEYTHYYTLGMHRIERDEKSKLQQITCSSFICKL